MTTENASADALMKGNMEEARTRFLNGETLSGRYVENNKSQILTNILRAKAFDLVDKLIDFGVIGIDIYEYDSFDRSAFKTMVMSLSNDESSISFLHDFMKKIRNRNAEVKDQTLLGFCMGEGADPAFIHCLIDEGCNAGYKNNADMNLIHGVVNKPMLDPVKGQAYIKLLLSQGVDANCRNIEGTTPLMAAVRQNKKEYLDLLLQSGADPNEQDNKGNTAFYYAAVAQRDSNLYSKLREYARPNFEVANRDNEHILTMYLRMGGGTTAEQLVLFMNMLGDGADIYQTSPWYGRPKSGVDWLAEKGPETLKAVLATGAIDLNRQDDQGNTILHTVCACKVNFDHEAANNIYRNTKLLIEAGADAGILNDKDETPLMIASKDNLKVRTVELLMQQQNH